MDCRADRSRQNDMQGIHINDPREEVLKISHDTGLSRCPLYGRALNDIRGVLSARACLLNGNTHGEKSVKELTRPAYFVPETIHADQLFRDMQRKKVHIAIVIDEYGETAGLITMEDLLEEIVGNIYDEFDPSEPKEIEQLEDNLWRVNGGVDIDTLSDALDIRLPESDEYETLGGMVFSCLTSIPQDGSKISVEVNGLHIQVEQIIERRIEKALVSKIQPAVQTPGE